MSDSVDWAEVRRRLGVSRETFARRFGLTPGAVWRIENKKTLRSGELEKLLPALDEKPATPTRVGRTATSAATRTAVISAPVEYAEPQWLEPGPAPRPPVIEATFTAPSPTELTRQDGFLRFSNSELGTFKDCRRRWWLSFYRGLRPRLESPTGPRATGDRVHRALALAYAPPGSPRLDPRDALEGLIVADWTSLVDDYAEDGVDRSLRETFRRDADLQRAMIEGYVRWLDETGADAEYEVVAPEAYLEADLPELGEIKIIAKIDVRVRRTTDGARLWLEHKTVGSFQQRLATINLDEQVLHQTLVESLQVGDEPRVVGVLYNMLRRSKRGVTAQPPFYRRVEVHRGQREVDSYRRRVVATIADVKRVRSTLDDGADHRDVAYPSPGGACAWKCPFVQVCPMFDDGSRVESALATYFVRDDPYSYYTGEVSVAD